MTTQRDHVLEVDNGSWHPIDIVLIGTLPVHLPTIGGLVYPGKKHVVAGEPEALKTYTFIAIALDEMRKGNAVMWIDFEMTGSDILSRLYSLGATDEEIRQFFIYLRPETALFRKADDTTQQDKLAALLDDRKPSLVVIDSFDAALGLEKLDPNSTAEVQDFWQMFGPFLTRAGSALVILDHLAKNREGRGAWSIGSQRKKSGADVHLIFNLKTPMSFTSIGRAAIVVGKDRLGQLTRPSPGVIVFEPAPPGGLVSYRLAAVAADAAPSTATFRPTALMQRISRYLESQSEAVSRTRVLESVEGKHAALRTAIEILISEKHVIEVIGVRQARLMHVEHPYREAEDRKSDRYTGDDPVPTSRPRPDYVPDVVTRPRPTPSHPFVGDGVRDGDVVSQNGHHPVPTANESIWLAADDEETTQ